MGLFLGSCQHSLDHRKSKRVPEKHLLLLDWLCQILCVDHNKLWKILKEMGMPDLLSCLLRNLYAGQETTVRTGHGKICQQIWKTQQWPQDWKRSVFTPIPKKGNAKQCSNYDTVALISHAIKVMLNILQARLQWYVNHELPDVQAGFYKRQKNQRSNCQYPLDHQNSKRVPEKHLLLLDWLCQSLWLCGSQQTGKVFKRWESQTTLPASWEICMQVQKQHLEPDIEQQTGSKLGKE